MASPSPNYSGTIHHSKTILTILLFKRISKGLLWIIWSVVLKIQFFAVSLRAAHTNVPVEIVLAFVCKSLNISFAYHKFILQLTELAKKKNHAKAKQTQPNKKPHNPNNQIQYHDVIHCKDNNKQHWVFMSSLCCTFLMKWINCPYCFTMNTTKSTCLLLQWYLVMDYLTIYLIFSSPYIFHTVNRIM